MASSLVLQVNVDELMQKQEKPNTTKMKNIYWSLFVKFLNKNAIRKKDNTIIISDFWINKS